MLVCYFLFVAGRTVNYLSNLRRPDRSSQWFLLHGRSHRNKIADSLYLSTFFLFTTPMFHWVTLNTETGNTKAVLFHSVPLLSKKVRNGCLRGGVVGYETLVSIISVTRGRSFTLSSLWVCCLLINGTYAEDTLGMNAAEVWISWSEMSSPWNDYLQVTSIFLVFFFLINFDITEIVTEIFNVLTSLG